MSSGCGCREVYRFPHITYPYSSFICSFLQQHPYFFIKKNVFRSLQYKALAVPLIRPHKVTQIYIYIYRMQRMKG